MQKHPLLISLLAAVLLPFSLSAQAPKYSNEFLAIGVGARGLAMGGALSASADDATAGYWNPAGLTRVKGNLQLALMHNEYFAGIAKYDYVSIAAPVDATRTVGFSMIRLAVDNILDTTELIDKDNSINYDKLKLFSSADYAFLFSYATKTKITGLTIGGNAKIIHRKVGDFAKAWGFGLDAGLQYEKGKWMFSAVGKDVTSTFNAWSFNTANLEAVFQQTGNEIPQNGLEVTLPRLILGTSYVADLTKKISVRPALDLDVTFDGKRNVAFKSSVASIDPKFGLEFAYDNFIFLRTGFNNLQQVKNIDNSTSTTVQPNLGVGLKIKNLTIDYALTNIGNSNGLLYSNVFSLKLNIFKQKHGTT